MASWDSLDFAVVAPADSMRMSYELRSPAFDSDDEGRNHPVFEVSLAVDPRPEDDPLWVLTTRPRRGVRPQGADLDYLSLDIDLPGAGADAVRHLLLHTLPPGLSHEELMSAVHAMNEASREIGRALSLRTPHSGPWRRERMQLDADVFALWVHRRERGWAAVADLGYATVTMAGVVKPAEWHFTALSPERARARLSSL